MKQIALTAVIRVGGAGLQFLFALGVTRLLSPAGAGVFFFGFSIVLILAVLARLGTELSGMRVLAGAREHGAVTALFDAARSRVRLCVGVATLCALGLAALAVPLATLRFEGTQAHLVLLAFAASLPALALLGLYAEFLKAVGLANWGVTAQNIMVPGGVCAILAVMLALDLPAHPAFVATSLCAVAWCGLGLTIVIWRRWGAGWRAAQTQIAEASPDSPDSLNSPETTAQGGAQSDAHGTAASRIWTLLKEAPVLLVVSTTSVAMQWMGSVVLGLVSSPETVAGYAVSIRLAIVVSTLNSAVTSVLAPRAAAAHARGDAEGLRRNAHLMSAFITLATFPILGVLFVFAGFWLSFFGPEYAVYAPALRILVLGQVLAALIGHSGIVLVMSGQYKPARWTSVLALVTLLATMPMLAAWFDVEGAALAMSLAVVVGHLAGVWFARRTLGFWTLPLGVRDLRRLFQRPQE